MEETIIKGEGFHIKKASLKQVRIDSANWMTYYVDEETNKKWVEEYPYSEMQGGGPPQLRLIQKFPWET